MKVRSSNRNAILLGNETQLVNIGLDEYTGGEEKKNPMKFDVSAISDEVCEGGEELDDDFKRMD